MKALLITASIIFSISLGGCHQRRYELTDMNGGGVCLTDTYTGEVWIRVRSDDGWKSLGAPVKK